MPDTDTYWSGVYDGGRDFMLMSSEALTKVLTFVDSGVEKACLDVGCGTGQLTRELYHRGYACVGTDAAASAIRIARSLTNASGIQYIHFDIERDDIAELPKQTYTLITCKLVYAFIKDKRAFIENVRKLLAPGGVFVVITPLTDDVPPERRAIAVNNDDVKLLATGFKQQALYKGNEPGGSLTYFVGCVE